MSILKTACTDWTSYIEINRPNCLTLMRFAKKQGPNRFGRLIWIFRQPSGVPGCTQLPTSPGLKSQPALVRFADYTSTWICQNATAWLATTAIRLHRLWCPIGGVRLSHGSCCFSLDISFLWNLPVGYRYSQLSLPESSLLIGLVLPILLRAAAQIYASRSSSSNRRCW
jgi:hypothetical protein